MDWNKSCLLPDSRCRSFDVRPVPGKGRVTGVVGRCVLVSILVHRGNNVPLTPPRLKGDFHLPLGKTLVTIKSP